MGACEHAHRAATTDGQARARGGGVGTSRVGSETPHCRQTGAAAGTATTAGSQPAAAGSMSSGRENTDAEPDKGAAGAPAAPGAGTSL